MEALSGTRMEAEWHEDGGEHCPMEVGGWEESKWAEGEAGQNSSSSKSQGPEAAKAKSRHPPTGRECANRRKQARAVQRQKNLVRAAVGLPVSQNASLQEQIAHERLLESEANLRAMVLPVVQEEGRLFFATHQAYEDHLATVARVQASTGVTLPLPFPPTAPWLVPRTRSTSRIPTTP